ncbi:MAG: hypothetical protein LLF92_08910 [Planctomycetaceae bacterium]|nr:hypothetical protein [Planctomycetaceae bacterium]
MKQKIKLGIAFVCGAVIGIILYADIFSGQEKPGVLTGPVTYGDIQIKPVTFPDADNKRLLCVQKNNYHFAAFYQDANGTTINGLFLNKKGDIICCMKPKREPTDRWVCDYSNDNEEGERYIDIDLDGKFDSKYLHDANGNIKERWIFFQDGWIQVEKASFARARGQQNNYYFGYDTGWLKDANSIQNDK